MRSRFTLSLDRNPLRRVTIPLEVTHRGGATAADYEGIPASVTFGPRERQADFIMRAVLDQQDETGEGLRIDFGPLPPGVRKGTWGPYETVEFVDTDPAAATLSVSGTVLTVDYPRALNGGSTPSPRDFVVSVEAVPRQSQVRQLRHRRQRQHVGDPVAVQQQHLKEGPPGGEKAMAPVAAVAVEGSDVFLQLARPVAPDDTVTLSYLADAMHPIRDEAGSPAAPLTDAPVRNQTPASGLGPEAGLRVQAANPAPLAALLEAAQVGAGTGRLDLSSRHLTDITALAGLTGLRELDLRNNAVTDLWPLAGLTNLQVLDLSGNQFTDLRPLAGLTSLQVLDLSGNQIADLWPLAELTSLQVLDLSGNQIADLWPLAELTGLQALDLSGNQIADLRPLTYLPALTRLNLMDNAVTDLWPLAELTSLQVLLLDRNQITDVQALSGLAGLANLGLAENQIANLWPLTGLDRLHRLDLSGNAVVDVSALGDVSGLVWLQLLGNPVSNAFLLGQIEQLRWLWLDAGTAAGM